MIRKISNWFLDLWNYSFNVHLFFTYFQRRTKTSQFGWFWSKWVYNFLPVQKPGHLSGYFSFKHHIWGGQQHKNMGKCSSSNAGPKPGFGPSGFIIFCLFKNLGTYQDIFHLSITYGVVNSTKIWAKSSSL